jgi:replication initiation protein RepC
MSGTDSQNERHIQKSIKYDFDSEDAAESGRTATKAVHPSSQVSEELNTEPNSPGLDLTALVQACPSVQDFYPNELSNWQDADRIAEKLIPMMGIDGSVLHDARVSMGRKHATTVVLCMLEKLGTIRSPGAYLRRLAQKARDGQFSPVPMLKSLLHNQKPAPIVS